MKRPHRIALVALILGLSIGCDQATKRIAVSALKPTTGYRFLSDTFRLQYAENKGAFLSLGAGLSEEARFTLLTVAVGLLLLGLLAYALLSRVLSRAQATGYGLVVGGGLSNWVDRALNQGSVVDFMNLGIGPVRTGVFNVADLAIMGGVALLLLAGWREDRRLKSASPPSP